MSNTFRNIINKLKGYDSEIKTIEDSMINSNNAISSINTEITALKAFDNTQRIGNIEHYRRDTDPDWTNAITRGFSYVDILYLKAGVYDVTNFSIPSGKTLIGEGRNTVLSFKSGTSIGISINGSIGSEINVTQNITNFSNGAVIANATTLNVGDYFMIMSQRDSLTYDDAGEDWCLGYRTPSGGACYFGEFKQLQSKSGNAIYSTDSYIYPSYYANNSAETSSAKRACSTVQKVSFASDILIKDIAIKYDFNPTQNGFTAIRGSYAKDVVVDNVNVVFENYNGTYGIGGIYFSHSYKCTIKNSKVDITKRPEYTDHFYANVFKFASSQYCNIDNCEGVNCTQTYDLTYYTNSIPCTCCSITNCTSLQASQTGITSHQGTYQSTISNNKVFGSKQGIFNRSRNAIVNNNIVNCHYSEISSSYGIGIGECGACNSIIKGNSVNGAFTGIYVTDGSDTDSYWRYCGTKIIGNTITGFVTGVFINRSPVGGSSTGLYVHISDNILYTKQNTSVSVTRGIYLGEISNTVKITGNIISIPNALSGSGVSNSAIYICKNCTNTEIYNNSFRGGNVGIKHLGNATTTSKIFAGGNIYVSVDTKSELATSASIYPTPTE